MGKVAQGLILDLAVFAITAAQQVGRVDLVLVLAGRSDDLCCAGSLCHDEFIPYIAFHVKHISDYIWNKKTPSYAQIDQYLQGVQRIGVTTSGKNFSLEPVVVTKMKEFLVVHDYQHGGFAFRTLAASRSDIESEIGDGFEIWENFREDKVLKSRFRISKARGNEWDGISFKTLSELKKIFSDDWFAQYKTSKIDDALHRVHLVLNRVHYVFYRVDRRYNILRHKLFDKNEREKGDR